MESARGGRDADTRIILVTCFSRNILRAADSPIFDCDRNVKSLMGGSLGWGIRQGKVESL